MKYTEEQLFDFMDSQRPVRVKCATGEVFEGKCWAYSQTYNEENEAGSEASLEIQDVMLMISEISDISYI